MHHMQKKAAAKKYGPLLTGENGEQEVTKQMTADFFTPEDIEEVIFEIKSQPNEGADQTPPPPPPPPPVQGSGDGNTPPPPPPVEDTKPKTLNKVYEEFRVAPLYDDVTDGMGKVLGKKLTGFRKLDIQPLKTTSIHPEKAAELNSQSINTGVHLFEKQ